MSSRHCENSPHRSGDSIVKDFVHELVTGRVVFGAGSIAQVADEVRRLGSSRVLIIGGGHEKVYADSIVEDLRQLAAGRIDEVVQHVPVEVAQAAIALSDRLGADLLLPVGGGSSIGLAKAIARERGLPILAVPTTYAGSEMSPIWGLTKGDRKTTGRDARVQPRVVVYDPNTTLSMPQHLTAVSGMNALAHAVEALYAPQVSPLVVLAAEQSVHAFARALPVLAANPQDSAARSDALYGAFLAGVSLGNAAMGIHHKICHVLGGAYNLPHGDIHSAVLPYAIAFNRDDAPEAMSRIEAALGSDDAAAGIWQLAHRIAAPTDLISTGFDADEIDAVAEVVATAAFHNPRKVTIEGVCDLLSAACAGSKPQR
jgi:maleylacetate reductase